MLHAVTTHGGGAPPPVHAVQLLAQPSVELHAKDTGSGLFSDKAGLKELARLPIFTVKGLAADVPARAGAAGDWSACHLERPVYAPGDVVRGQVVVRVAARRVVRSVGLRVACAETALLRFSTETSNGQGGGSTSHFYLTGAHVRRINQHLAVAESSVALLPGFNVFPFAFQLPASGPGSTYSRMEPEDKEDAKYNGSLAHIEYTLNVVFGEGGEGLGASQGLVVQGVPAPAAVAVALGTAATGSGGGRPSASREESVRACCCLDRGRVAISLSVLGEAVAGQPLRLRVAVDNSAGTGAVAARVKLFRVFLHRLDGAALMSAARGSAQWDKVEERLLEGPRNLLAKATICDEVEAGARADVESSALVLPEGAAATGERGLLALVEYHVSAVVDPHFGDGVEVVLVVRPGFARPAAWGIARDARTSANFLRCGAEDELEEEEEEEKEEGGSIAATNPLADARAAAAARSGASKT